MNHDDKCSLDPDHSFDCMVCGRELYYTSNLSVHAKCYYCGKEDITNVVCLNGHYVCDECHRKDIMEIVERICAASESTDPVALALSIFDLKQLHMHGPEYHSIVPAVLVSAYGNSINKKDAAAIKEAILRGKAIFGGICGTHGACGACIGVGIAYSLIHNVTPYSKEVRGEANRMTALALISISRYGGPRCCKRDSMLAIETAKKNFGFFDDNAVIRYKCSQLFSNQMCIQNECPFYPNKETE